MRALGFIMLNRWSKSFKPHTKKTTLVKGKIGNKTITRKKGGRLNLYKIDKKTFKALGQGKVPEEVANLINVGDENFQRQLDAHFWFTDTPGQVSKKLNRIVNLEKIDNALAYLAKSLKKAAVEVDLTKTRYLEAKQSRIKTQFILKINSDLKAVESAIKDVITASRIRENAGGMIRGAIRLEREYDTLSNAIIDAGNVKRIARETSKTRLTVKRLKKLIKDAKITDRESRIEIPDMKELLEVRYDADDAAESRRNLEMVISDFNSSEETVCHLQKHLKDLMSDLAIKTKTRCPTCGAKMTKVKKLKLMSDQSSPF